MFVAFSEIRNAVLQEEGYFRFLVFLKNPFSNKNAVPDIVKINQGEFLRSIGQFIHRETIQLRSHLRLSLAKTTFLQAF